MSVKEKQFESLVRSFYQPLYRYAFWLSKSQATAEDIVQETFARAWKNLHQLKDAKSAKPWLYTILSRENARRFERKQLPMVDLQEDWQLEQIANPNTDKERFVLMREILKLPEHFRVPLALQIIGGLTTEEVADVLSINANTVSTRLFRARATLKERFASEINRGSSNG